MREVIFCLISAKIAQNIITLVISDSLLGCVDKKFNEKEIKGEGCNNKGEVVVSS